MIFSFSTDDVRAGNEDIPATVTLAAREASRKFINILGIDYDPDKEKYGIRRLP